VDVGRDPLLLPQPLGEADVVGVAVGEDQRPNVVEGLAKLDQRNMEIATIFRTK